jgi:hypothetical protein
MKWSVLMLCVLSFCCVTKINAQVESSTTYTGNWLLERCQPAANYDKTHNPSELEYAHMLSCFGYVKGWRDAMTAQYVVNKIQKRSNGDSVCIPDDSTNGELAKVLVKYLNEHPTQLHYEAGVVAYQAFRLAYPCS